MTTYPTDTIRTSSTADRPASWVDTDGDARSGVSWPAIFAGATAAAALTLIMLLLGAGTGLGVSSPWSGEGAEAKTIGIAGVFWITFTQIAASGLGGYLAGRLRTKWNGLHTDEARFRDTAHGFLAWGVATLVTSALLMSAVGSAVSAGARAGMGLAGGVVTSAVGVGTAAASRSGDEGAGGPMGYMVDAMLRKDANAPAQAAPATPAATTGTDATASAPAPAPASTAPAAPIQAPNTASTGELSRIVANALRTGTLSPEDTRYAGQLVAQRTGLSQQEAEKRVTDTYTRAKLTIDEAQTKAKQAADAARKTASYGALWIFISLVIGALVAAYSATLGGRARDL